MSDTGRNSFKLGPQSSRHELSSNDSTEHGEYAAIKEKVMRLEIQPNEVTMLGPPRLGSPRVQSTHLLVCHSSSPWSRDLRLMLMLELRNIVTRLTLDAYPQQSGYNEL